MKSLSAGFETPAGVGAPRRVSALVTALVISGNEGTPEPVGIFGCETHRLAPVGLLLAWHPWPRDSATYQPSLRYSCDSTARRLPGAHAVAITAMTISAATSPHPLCTRAVLARPALLARREGMQVRRADESVVTQSCGGQARVADPLPPADARLAN